MARRIPEFNRPLFNIRSTPKTLSIQRILHCPKSIYITPKMRLNIGRRALLDSWSRSCLYCAALILFALILQSIFEWLIACLITMLFRPWRTWDYRIFHSSMAPFEFHGSILMTCFVLYLYVIKSVSARCSTHPPYIENMRLIIHLEAIEFCASLFDNRKVWRLISTSYQSRKAKTPLWQS